MIYRREKGENPLRLSGVNQSAALCLARTDLLRKRMHSSRGTLFSRKVGVSAVPSVFSYVPQKFLSRTPYAVRMASQDSCSREATDTGTVSRSPLSIEVAGSHVQIRAAAPVSDDELRRAVASSPFQKWLEYLKGPAGILNLEGGVGNRCSLKEVVIQSVDMFGPRVGFVKFKAEVVDDATGVKLPGIVFARGGAVGILMLLTCEDETFVVLTEQARVPVGRTILELPAGMLDDDEGDFVGTAAREVEEETGIHIKTSDLVNLTDYLEESTGRKMFPSPGGSDEDITLMLYRGTVSKKVLDSLQGQQTGLRDHGELIKVHIVPYSKLWRLSADSKALSAIALYEMATREGLLPPPPNVPELSHL